MEPPHHSANQRAGKMFMESDIETENADYVNYLKQMVASLLENQMNLSAALDETREACAQLNLQNSELQASSTQEVQVLQTELSICRQREAATALAYEDLRSRVEAIDQVIEQVPCLDILFNSDYPLPVRLKALKCGGNEGELAALSAIESHPFRTSPKLRSVSYDEDVDRDAHDNAEVDMEAVNNDITPHHHVPVSAWQEAKRTGSASPLSDSGCTSESHDEISVASLNSAHSSTYLAVMRGQLDGSQISRPNGCVRMYIPPLKRSATYTTVNGKNTENGGWKLGKIAESLRASISRFADKSEWKMEALVAKQREARALTLLNETQAEVRKVESRCTGLTRRQDEQELRMSEKEKEIDRLVCQERELRRDLRVWQQRVFQLEAETQEILHNCQIAELEMKSRLLETSMFAANPADLVTMQNSISLFSDDLHRFKVLDGGSSPTTTTIAPSDSELQVDSNRLPKFARSNLCRHPRFASVTSLSRLHLNPHGQIPKVALEISRPASSLQLNQSPGSIEGMQCPTRGSILTTSFGSFSELELIPTI